MITEIDLAFETECTEYGPSPWNNSVEGPQRWQKLFSIWLSELVIELPYRMQRKSYSLGLRLIDDKEIRILNNTWRGINYPTDVLSFPSQEGKEATYHLQSSHQNIPIELGDIIVSVETADRQAIHFGHNLGEELHWLVSHGLLHLLGWTHPDEISLSKMLQRQEKLLSNSFNQRTKP